MRKYYDKTWHDKFHDRLDEDNVRALDLQSEIKASMDELQDPSPEEHAAYKQISAAVENLLAVRFDFNCTPEVAANEPLGNNFSRNFVYPHYYKRESLNLVANVLSADYSDRDI